MTIKLTDTEVKLAQYIANGLTSAQVRKLEGWSTGYQNNRVCYMLRKTGCIHRPHLIATLLRKGIIK